MRKAANLMLAASCVVLSGCLSGFKHPLGPAAEGFIEPQLLGRWDCVSADDPTPGPMTFLDFDGKQYYLQFEVEKGEVGHFRAYATGVEDVPFLNVRAIGPKADDEWSFLEYTLVDADHLTFRYVDPQPFNDIIDDGPGVKAHLESHLQDPEVVGDFLSCARAEAVESE